MSFKIFLDIKLWQDLKKQYQAAVTSIYLSFKESSSGALIGDACCTNLPLSLPQFVFLLQFSTSEWVYRVKVFILY